MIAIIFGLGLLAGAFFIIRSWWYDDGLGLVGHRVSFARGVPTSVTTPADRSGGFAWILIYRRVADPRFTFFTRRTARWPRVRRHQLRHSPQWWLARRDP